MHAVLDRLGAGDRQEAQVGGRVLVGPDDDLVLPFGQDLPAGRLPGSTAARCMRACSARTCSGRGNGWSCPGGKDGAGCAGTCTTASPPRWPGGGSIRRRRGRYSYRAATAPHASCATSARRSAAPWSMSGAWSKGCALGELGLTGACAQAVERLTAGPAWRPACTPATTCPHCRPPWRSPPTASWSEAVTNTVRHAPARHCRVSIACTPAGLAVAVTDDGTGLVAAGQPGHGLAIMRERAP